MHLNAELLITLGALLLLLWLAGALVLVELRVNRRVGLEAPRPRSTVARADPLFGRLLRAALAAAEAAVALAIALNFYNNHATIDVDRADELKG